MNAGRLLNALRAMVPVTAEVPLEPDGVPALVAAVVPVSVPPEGADVVPLVVDSVDRRLPPVAVDVITCVPVVAAVVPPCACWSSTSVCV